jgi:hypothetical protein
LSILTSGITHILIVNEMLLNVKSGPDAVAHACNPSYLEGGDHEDHGLRPAQEKRPQVN